MTPCFAPACSQALPVKPQGVWARGIEAWAWSRDRRNLEFLRWGSSGLSSLMACQVLEQCPGMHINLNAYGAQELEFTLLYDGLVQDCNNSNALAVELLQSCTKPSKWFVNIGCCGRS